MCSDTKSNLSPPAKIIDLSHTLYNGMPSWPTHPQPSFEQTLWTARDGYALTLLKRMTTHTGTHVDVPAHFIAEGKKVSDIPIEKFVGAGVVLDLSPRRSGEEIGVGALEQFDEQIQRGDVVMLHTGWDKKRAMTSEYLFEWPYLGLDAANHLASKGVKAVGTDCLSIAGWAGSVAAHGPVTTSSPSEVHKALLSQEILIIEELAHLDLVLAGSKSRRAWFCFAPLNVIGADGGPCRAVALT